MATDNAYGHGSTFMMLARALGYDVDARRILEDFIPSVTEKELKKELRMRKPAIVEEAMRILHNLIMAVADQPLPAASYSPVTS